MGRPAQRRRPRLKSKLEEAAQAERKSMAARLLKDDWPRTLEELEARKRG